MSTRRVCIHSSFEVTCAIAHPSGLRSPRSWKTIPRSTLRMVVAVPQDNRILACALQSINPPFIVFVNVPQKAPKLHVPWKEAE